VPAFSINEASSSRAMTGAVGAKGGQGPVISSTRYHQPSDEDRAREHGFTGDAVRPDSGSWLGSKKAGVAADFGGLALRRFEFGSRGGKQRPKVGLRFPISLHS